MERHGSFMNFGDKVKDLRTQRKMTQGELAEALNISPRTIFAYENGENYPRKREVYKKLADFFSVEINYLLTEDEEFITYAAEMYGTRGQEQALALLEQASALFAGGDLSEDDQLAFVHEIQQLYLDSKERAKRFTPKKYRKDGN
jgi:transcriptional regulator with XRE-family HTH domain